jgi:amidase
MADEGLTRRSARELAAMIKSRAVSPLEVLDAHLAVIARVNPKLNAIVTLAADQARAQARATESAVMRGDSLEALAGLPVAIKDITPTAGIRTTFGSPLYKDHVPDEDAEAVRRLKAAGAVVLGKTNTPEFAAGANTVNALFGATRNPWNGALSPAGSPEDRRWRSPRVWCRLRRAPTSVARSEFLQRSAASSEYGRRRA